MKGLCCLALILTFCMPLSGCAAQDEGDALGTDASGVEISAGVNASDMFSDRDFDTGYNVAKSAVIQLSGDTAVCASDAVRIAGGTITIIDEGTYLLSGTLDGGMIIVNAVKKNKVQLVLDGANIHSETSAAIYVLQADKVFVTLAEGSENALSNGGAFTAIDDSNIDSAIFSKEDLTLNGSGALSITSPAGHGIVSKDSLTVTGGTYTINCASHGLSGKDDVCIANADITIVAGKDGIQADNADDAARGFVYIESGVFNITAEGDGVSASSYVQINGGDFHITSGGGSGNAAKTVSDSWGGFMGGGRRQGGGTWDSRSGLSSTNLDSDGTSMKGVKAATSLVINSGVFVMNCADDALHSNASMQIGGGEFVIASGDDAFHANDTLTVTAGTINVTESYEGLEGLHISITGGDITIVASDDCLNAAGGTDESGTTGGRDGMFGRGMRSSSNGSITISGGVLHITAYGDGIDANGTLTITGGHTTVCGPTQGDTATLDYDTSATISGGTFIGTGSTFMAQTFSDADQGVIAISVGSQQAGTNIILTDSNGKTVLEHTPGLAFAVVILSSPDITSGETYTITVGSLSGQIAAD